MGLSCRTNFGDAKENHSDKYGFREILSLLVKVLFFH